MQNDKTFNLSKLLEKIRIKINTYNFKNSELTLVYSNYQEVNTTTSLSKYCKLFKNNKEQVENFFNDFKTTKFEFNENLVTLEKYDDDLVYEITYLVNCKEKAEIEFILATASSRIRYPLTNIAGLLPLIQTYNKNDKQYQQYVELVQDSSGDIISVANDLIDILNFKKNKIIVKNEEIVLDKLVKSCINILNKKIKDNRVIITYNIDNDVPKIVFSDKDKIKQILINLMSNSIKFTKVGSIIVNISIDSVKNKESGIKKYNLVFKIKDTGIGISPEKQAMINTILNGECSKAFKLCGFGIYISHYTCNLLGGKIWFNSVSDMGSVFYFNVKCSSLD